MEFAHAQLKRLREAKGLTQDYVAEQAGLSRQQYMNLEAGKNTPRLETIDKIAKVLGVPGQFLIEDGVA